MYLALYQTKLNWPMLKPSWARLIDWLKELKQENSEPWFHCASGNVFSGEEQIKHLEFFFTCVTRSMFSGSWFSRAPPQSTVILLALQRHCKCEENELFFNINLQLASNLAKLWAQSSCRCCQCGQNEENQGLGVEEGQKELGEEDHQLGHHHNNPAPWGVDSLLGILSLLNFLLQKV